jgi:hypothetical protein
VFTAKAEPARKAVATAVLYGKGQWVCDWRISYGDSLQEA